MRALFPLVSIAVVALSLALDVFPRSPSSKICLYGGCRSDQILAGADNSGGDSVQLRALLNEDPANPSVWATYGEILSTRGQTDSAARAFDRAVALGPGMSPVLMRAINFDFGHGRTEPGLRLSSQILAQTNAFDEIVFSYLKTTGKPAAELVGKAVPVDGRAARAWLQWLGGHGSDSDVIETWSWMRRNHLDDEKSAADTTSVLWQHKQYREAEELWRAWLGGRQANHSSELLANERFVDAPHDVPFDWSLTATPGVEVERKDGLDVRFLGQANVEDAGVGQFTTAEPGRYRLVADLDAMNLTTDSGVFFRISDAENPGRMSVETRPLLGTVPRSSVELEFTVPTGTRAIEVQLMRKPSLKFDSKIEGALHIHAVSLRAAAI